MSHTLVLSKTRHGKTNLLLNMYQENVDKYGQDGVYFVDPKEEITEIPTVSLHQAIISLRKNGGVLIIDELPLLFDEHETELTKLVSTCASFGITVICASQQTIGMLRNTAFRTQFTTIFLGAVGEKDIKFVEDTQNYLKEDILEVRKQIKKLPKYTFLKLDDGEMFHVEPPLFKNE